MIYFGRNMSTRKRKLNINIKNEVKTDSDYSCPKKIKIEENKKNKRSIKTSTITTATAIRTKIKKNFQQNNSYSICETEADVKPEHSPVHIKQGIGTSFLDAGGSKGDDYSLTQKCRQNECTTNDSNAAVNCQQSYELLSKYENIDLDVAKNIVKLFDQGCTIPFIARYRKDMSGNMSPEALRRLKQNYDKISILKTKMQTTLNCIGKLGVLNHNLRKSIVNATTVEEIEHIYAPFKQGNKKTLVERARALGLQEPAQKILEKYGKININDYVDKNHNELNSYDKVQTGIKHIIAYIISTDTEILVFLRKLKAEGNFIIEVKKLRKKTTKSENTISQLDISKYDNYFNFKMPTRFIKPHQVLAINRGESQKILSVKIVVPELILRKFATCCREKFMYNTSDSDRRKMLDESINDSYSRLVEPLLIREVRSELKQSAEMASYEVFCTNLKQLLLTPPIKGRSILGIDPGFFHGCKAAIISPTGTFLASDIFYLHNNKMESGAKRLKSTLEQHNCNLIAIGNGTGCRETETWLSDLINRQYFYPLDVSYIIVSENGASIYSCSREAQEEFAELDPNIISAVSLARRIQEPLAEFVKVEPKHLGIGMYQHDLPKKKLDEALDDVVSECVSFVGVDLNTASQCLLRKVAGLSDRRATKIIEYRNKKGRFISRKELMEINGIGSKSFEQCAGFLRVGPITVEEEDEFYKNPQSNKLDCTIIHPESYELTSKLIKQFNLELTNVGSTIFINAIREKTCNKNFNEFCKKHNASEQTLRLIIDALSKPLNYDLRYDCSKVPLFKKGINTMLNLQIGTILTGRVTNNTLFGSFVDIGVGCNGLIHSSKMKSQTLKTGDTVEVRVLNVDINKKRIGLELTKIV